MEFSRVIFLLKQKAAYEIRPRDWSSDVCSSDLVRSATLAGESLKRCRRESSCPRVRRSRKRADVCHADRLRYRSRTRNRSTARRSTFLYQETSVSSPTGDVAAGEALRSWSRVRQRDVLHPQIRQQTVEHLLLLRRQVPGSLLVQHSEHVDPVLAQFDIDLALVCNGMFHHSQR